MVAAQEQPAHRGGARSDDPSAGERPGPRDLRPRILDRRHLAAPGRNARGLFWPGATPPPQDVTPRPFDKPVHLFDIEPKARYGFSTQGMNYHLFGDKYLEVPNEPEALVVNYLLKADADAGAKITVKDLAGKVLREVDGPAKAGLNHA